MGSHSMAPSLKQLFASNYATNSGFWIGTGYGGGAAGPVTGVPGDGQVGTGYGGGAAGAGQGASAIDDEDEDNSMDESNPVDSDAEPSIVDEPSTARNPAGLPEMQLREGGDTYERATAAGDGRVGMGAESRGCFASTRRMLNNTSWDERLVPLDLETTMESLLHFLAEPVTAWMNTPQHLFRRRQTTYINVSKALGAQPHPSLRSQYNSLREQTKQVADGYRGEAAAFRRQHDDIMKVQKKLLSAAEELQGEMDALWSAAAVREQSAAQLEQKGKFDAHQLFRQQYELGTSFTLESRDVEPFAPAFFTTDVVNARTLLEERMRELPGPADQPGAAITVADAPDLATDRVACSAPEIFNAINTRGFHSYEAQPNKQDMPRETMSTYDIEPKVVNMCA
ncbi:hypothetical protein VOLCADRAFT_105535 [Volvox carteri f. nagariensis]|uniref:Uncharacterized protein n=1 Tax=Volvox carteri f. nagariensis TaxID=3068 RepID=D8U1F7_VOLCA|nr:uncharacterized protein VOLCADRAFT_105535 [Volvox carteri f. nagariensis]EFJ46329.1 hypothetical protein VOLCADRAFT_105535 [Volvox carteri f. nagariensis]|eukprot:XP_002952482.1 hypothetical protein VOLCADRAFT_105535 [Volvox carteri f. nagariensis]